MRLAVLSDIHGNLAALEAALADLKAAGSADKLWFLGDYAAFGPRPAECVQRLQALTTEWGENNIGFIRGNTDRYLVDGTRPKVPPPADADSYSAWVAARSLWGQNLNWGWEHLGFAEYEWLSKLRHELDLHVPGFGWVIGYHGIPGDDEGILNPETPVTDADDMLLDREGTLGIGGHIHWQLDRMLSQWRVVNVGSVGMSFQMPGHAQYGLLSFDGNTVTVDLRAVPYDVEQAIADLRARNYPGFEEAAQRLRPKT